MVQISALATATPEHRVDAAETKAMLAAWLPEDAARRYGRVVDATRIRRRYAVEPFRVLRELQTPDARNATYAAHALALGEHVVRNVLGAAALDGRALDAIVPVTCTGYMMPSLDAYLINTMKLNPHARRVPIMQLGCAAGVGAVGLAAQLLRHAAHGHVLIVSVELCSLCLQAAEPSPADLMGSLLFGDGAAAAVVSAGARAGGPEILASRSVLLPDSEDVLQMHFTQTGPRFVLSRELPAQVRRQLRGAAEAFLDGHGVRLPDVRFHVIHPGGPKVLEAVAQSLELSDAAVQPSWQAWERYGNLSSATVFFILEGLQASAPPRDGDLGLMLAVGPGLTCEMVLLRSHGACGGAA